jgi:hypothetical protein
MPLTKDRNTPARDDALYVYPVAANVRIHAGALVVLDGANAKPGAAGAGLIAAGRAEVAVNNTGGAAGAATVKVRRGVFRYKNSAADAIAAADVGSVCFVQDDETVAKTSNAGERSPAGLIREVDASGVWVAIGLPSNLQGGEIADLGGTLAGTTDGALAAFAAFTSTPALSTAGGNTYSDAAVIAAIKGAVEAYAAAAKTHIDLQLKEVQAHNNAMAAILRAAGIAA